MFLIRIFVVDDHPITCDGLAEWLPMKADDILTVGTVYTGLEALDQIEQLLPEVV